MSTYKPGQHPNSKKNLLSKPPKGAARKGAYAAMAAKKKKKEIRDVLEYLLHIPIQPGRTKKLKSIIESKSKNMTVFEGMAVAQIKKALAGDTKAFKALVEVMGREKDVEEYQVQHDTDQRLIEAMQDRVIENEIQEQEDVTFEEDQYDDD